MEENAVYDKNNLIKCVRERIRRNSAQSSRKTSRDLKLTKNMAG